MNSVPSNSGMTTACQMFAPRRVVSPLAHRSHLVIIVPDSIGVLVGTAVDEGVDVFVGAAIGESVGVGVTVGLAIGAKVGSGCVQAPATMDSRASEIVG